MSTLIDSSSLTLVAATRASSLPPFLHRMSVNLPDYRGLKINHTLKTTRSSFLSQITIRSSGTSRGGVSVACEAQDIAVDIPALSDDSWMPLVLQSDSPVLVEFWAPWCGPCRMIHPVIDELAKQYSGKLKCYRVNTDDCSAIASEYGIRSIPTVIIVKNGAKKDTVIGAVPKSTLTSTIEKFL
ncbi:hypothetical protein ACFE04_023529 [Oxalis oulophora]